MAHEGAPDVQTGRVVTRPQPSALAALRKSVDPLPPLHAVLVIVSRVASWLDHLRIGGTATRTSLRCAVLARKDNAHLLGEKCHQPLVSGPAAVHSLNRERERSVSVRHHEIVRPRLLLERRRRVIREVGVKCLLFGFLLQRKFFSVGKKLQDEATLAEAA